MKKISIIMPIYNVEKYLEKGVESVLSQTYKNLEVILVDDGSPDNSGQMCDNLAKKDARIKVVHKQNGGVSSARNAGLDVATGDYITFLDPDDIADSTMYEKLVVALEQNNADIAMCGIKYVYEDGNEKNFIENNLKNINNKNIYEYFLISGSIEKENAIYTDNIMGSVCRVLFKKEAIGENRFPPFSIYEDLQFLIDVINDNKIAVVNEYLYYYFQRSTSVMHIFSQKSFEQRVDSLRSVIDKIKNKVNENSIKAFKFYVYAFCVNELMKNNQKELLKEFMQRDFVNEFNVKENYKAELKQTKGFKRRIAYFLVHKKWFKLYSLLLKLA